MEETQNRYWPFDVLPPERRTELHCEEIKFLEDAFRAGYGPYMFGSENFGAVAGERAGEIFFRGRGHWEVSLVCATRPVVAAHLTNFASAANALLTWLGGTDGKDIIENARSHLLSSRATGPGFTLSI